MSVVVETFLVCDGNCGENFGIDFRSLTANEHRKIAKENGWICKNGKDYCPVCAKKNSQPVNNTKKRSINNSK